MKISAIVTSIAEPQTLEDVAIWLSDLKEFGQPDTLELIDGAQLYPAGHPDRTLLNFGDDGTRPTLRDVAAWLASLEALGLPNSTLVEDGNDLAVDFAIVDTESIGCGNCSLLDILVNAHSDCGH